MLSSLSIENLTAFSSATLKFGKHLNVLVGENGTGKTHILKVAYSVLATSAEIRASQSGPPTKSLLQPKLAEKLIGVFRPEALGRLTRRAPSRQRCDISVKFFAKQKNLDIDFNFATNSKTEVTIEKLPTEWVSRAPVYIPTRELMTIYPNFVPFYEGHYLDIEETWRDTCLLLGRPLQRGPRESTVPGLLDPLAEAMGGKVELDQNGRFYFRDAKGRLEMHLLAEGLWKLAMIARLIATGALLERGWLFWDEPESNLNPRLIREAAAIILKLGDKGIQVFIATHSLFLLRELDILLRSKEHLARSVRYFGLQMGDDGVRVAQGTTIQEIGDIAALDEQLEQSDRYLATDDQS